MEIEVKDNIKEVTRWLTEVQKKQIPYAASRALNDTAVDGQNSVVAAIPHIFRNRKKWWLRQQPTGIKVRFSKKTDLKATIHTSAYFAEIQEQGGIKTPRSSKHLAVPTDRVPKKYRTSHGAKEMMNEKKNVFRTPKGIFRRTGKKNITLLWSFTASAKVPRRFPFYEILEKAVKRRFSEHFKKRLAQALATAKPPSRK